MKKLNPAEVAGGAVISVTTGVTVANLAVHDVGALTLVTVALSMLSSGIWLLMAVMKGVTTQVYRCSVEGCAVEIRATRNHTQARLAVLEGMATDHTSHGSAGV
ncbi:hypothetical protein B0675_39970 [Streptomyces sp. M41(2017)]|uniref:hypothetical protein n=1 Tax=Streptomyces sp. M41(2017) TaxID=1955065 RepID=UPI0009C02F72|nr:hypothetical protein [Streptomyces sp. M41(2017)]OQQ12997.1 hypothetical protein B0675_39970 [Streptomyces sp. M41(2017)]